VRRQNPETKLYKKAIQIAALAGFKAWRENTGVRNQGRYVFGFKGKPDIVGHHLRTGQALYWECKDESTDRRITKEQWLFMYDADREGCHVRVFTDKGIYALDEVPAKLLPRGAK